MVFQSGSRRLKKEKGRSSMVRGKVSHCARPLIAVLLLTLLFASACTGAQEKEATYTRAYTGAPIEFYDLNKFDRELSGALRGKSDNVTVVFPAAVSLNAIPERVNRWLSEIESKGGEITVIKEGDDSAARGIISEVIGLITTAVKYAREAIIFGPAANYNASLYYDCDSGEVTRLVFTLKPPGDKKS